jgi:hypothetical protein
MKRVALYGFLIAYLATAYALVVARDNYNNLLTWACENASLGGYECGED